MTATGQWNPARVNSSERVWLIPVIGSKGTVMSASLAVWVARRGWFGMLAKDKYRTHGRKIDLLVSRIDPPFHEFCILQARGM